MAKPRKATVLKAHFSGQETAMDKTTRIVKEMIDEETEKRQEKITRLRKTRLEREAKTPPEANAADQKKRRAKAVPK